MVLLKLFPTEGLDNLSSQSQLELLDAVDTLRSQGISQHISLPQIIVCGDQSSGKSSVLEAISGVAFPVKSNLCTRFPTELSLRKSRQTGVKVMIVPHHSRTEFEKSSLAAFDQRLDTFESLPDLIEQAKVAMGIASHGPAFSKDLLRIEITGPDRPQLTIVDLPGLIHSENQQQSASDIQLIREVVKGYMSEPRSIILTVVSAKNDIANQVVLKLAREADPKGTRTLGVITKPDTLYPGSESEKTYISLAKNHNIQFRLGWHVLRNRDADKESWTLVQRHQGEAEFFAESRAWGALQPTIRGIESLRTRLSELLLSQIALELPNLIEEIGEKAKCCEEELNQLGEPRVSKNDQRAYLTKIGQSAWSLVQSATTGIYEDPFFDGEDSTPCYEKRFRAVIQNLNREFASSLRKEGNKYHIKDSCDVIHESQKCMTRRQFVLKVIEMIEQTRGRELPGMFNPMIVSDLFKEQSSPWSKIAEKHMEELIKATEAFLRHLVLHLADTTTAAAISEIIVFPFIKSLKSCLNAKLQGIFEPLRCSHPITYNHSFQQILQDARRKRETERLSNALKAITGQWYFPMSKEYVKIDVERLFQQMAMSSTQSIDERAASDAIDCLEAYYTVRKKR